MKSLVRRVVTAMSRLEKIPRVIYREIDEDDGGVVVGVYKAKRRFLVTAWMHDEA